MRGPQFPRKLKAAADPRSVEGALACLNPVSEKKRNDVCWPRVSTLSDAVAIHDPVAAPSPRERRPRPHGRWRTSRSALGATPGGRAVKEERRAPETPLGWAPRRDFSRWFTTGLEGGESLGFSGADGDRAFVGRAKRRSSCSLAASRDCTHWKPLVRRGPKPGRCVGLQPR